MQPSSFNTAFALTDAGRPFPCELLKRFISDEPNDVPASSNIPTGLGKTLATANLQAARLPPDRSPSGNRTPPTTQSHGQLGRACSARKVQTPLSLNKQPHGFNVAAPSQSGRLLCRRVACCLRPS